MEEIEGDIEEEETIEETETTEVVTETIEIEMIEIGKTEIIVKGVVAETEVEAMTRRNIIGREVALIAIDYVNGIEI